MTGVNRTHYSKTNTYRFELDPLLKVLQYNTVEGIAINPSFTVSKFVKSLKSNVSFIADFRYGFNNNHFNAWGGLKFAKGILILIRNFKQAIILYSAVENV